MSCCCLKILNLCKVPVCGELVINQPASGVSGSGEENIYTLVLDFLNVQITLSQLQVEGEDIRFDVSGLNEYYEFTGKVYDAEGNLVNITVGEDEFDCIKFKTILNVS